MTGVASGGALSHTLLIHSIGANLATPGGR